MLSKYHQMRMININQVQKNSRECKMTIIQELLILGERDKRLITKKKNKLALMMKGSEMMKNLLSYLMKAIYSQASSIVINIRKRKGTSHLSRIWSGKAINHLKWSLRSYLKMLILVWLAKYWILYMVGRNEPKLIYTLVTFKSTIYLHNLLNLFI